VRSDDRAHPDHRHRLLASGDHVTDRAAAGDQDIIRFRRGDARARDREIDRADRARFDREHDLARSGRSRG